MASAKAVIRIDWTRIWVDAPGLQPTASEGFLPMNPTPSPEPRAARPTVGLPDSTANIGAIISFSSLFVGFLGPRGLATVGPKNLMGIGAVALVVLADQQCEDGGQQHEYHRLHNAGQQLHEVEGNRNHDCADGPEPRRVFNQFRHRFHHVFSREYISVKTEAQRDGTKENRKNL